MTLSELHTQSKYNKTMDLGSGVQRMITECRKAGVAEPAYHTTAIVIFRCAPCRSYQRRTMAIHRQKYLTLLPL